MADLLVYPERNRERGIGSRIGSISEYRKGKVIEIRVELIASYHPFRLLIVQMEEIELNDNDLEFKYGRLSIADAALSR